MPISGRKRSTYKRKKPIKQQAEKTYPMVKNWNKRKKKPKTKKK